MMNKEGMGMEMAGASMAAGKKEGKGMMMGMMMCAVIAIAGIGFGVYEFMQANSARQQIADLKVEIKKDDGTTTTIETDKIEVKKDDKTIVISDSPIQSFRNPIISSNDEATMTGIFESDDYYTERRNIVIYYTNGEITECSILKPSSDGYGKTTVANCQINGVSGKISTISRMGNTQMSWPYLGLLLEDGTVDYISASELAENFSATVKGKVKFEPNKPVTNIVDNIGFRQANTIGGHRTTAFYHSDGSMSIFNDSMLTEE